jgi:DNA-binding transcriptional MerR regulator
MRLKTSYSAREVAALTGLSARQLQGWDQTRVFPSAISPRQTSAGGFTERRYTPGDVLELLALAALRRQGFTPAVLRQMMDALAAYFRRRLLANSRIATDDNCPKANESHRFRKDHRRLRRFSKKRISAGIASSFVLKVRTSASRPRSDFSTSR